MSLILIMMALFWLRPFYEMKLHYKQSQQGTLESFYVKRTFRPHVGGDWHFHREFELIYFLKGNGIRMVGDHISHFREGELVLVGAWLPHLWRNDLTTTHHNGADFIVVKFSEEMSGINLFALPELAGIKNLLKRSSRGVAFSQLAAGKIHDLMIGLSNSRSSQRLIFLLSILEILANEEEYQLLSNPDFSVPKQVSGANRLQKVIAYISEHYAQPIALEEIAGIAIMTPPAFCRFFKNRTNRTFSHFLNEFRVNKACQLLINNEKNIKHICYDVGFTSLTNFNRAFRNFKDLTPSEYRQYYRTLHQR